MSAAFVGRALAKVELSVFFPPLRGEGNLRDPRRKGAKPTRPTAERVMPGRPQGGRLRGEGGVRAYAALRLLEEVVCYAATWALTSALLLSRIRKLFVPIEPENTPTRKHQRFKNTVPSDASFAQQAAVSSKLCLMRRYGLQSTTGKTK